VARVHADRSSAAHRGEENAVNSPNHLTRNQRNRRNHRRRLELAWVLVIATLAAGAAIVLLTATNITPLVAAGGIFVALDLPACGYIIWRAAREDLC
jgi:type VI protein secretion system component VasK